MSSAWPKLIVLLSVAACAASCGEAPMAESRTDAVDNQDAPRPRGDVSLRFAHSLGGGPLVLGRERLLPGGLRVSIDQVSYPIGQVALENADERAELPLERMEVLFGEGAIQTRSGAASLPTGRYDAIALRLAPPEAGSGQRGLRVSGSFRQGETEGAFALEVDGLPGEVVVEGGLDPVIEVEQGEIAEIVLLVTLDRLFTGLDLAREPVHSDVRGMGFANAVAANARSMFALPPTPTRQIDGDDGRPIPTDTTPPALTSAIVELEELLAACEGDGCVTPFQLGGALGFPANAGALTFVARADAPVFAASPGEVVAVEFEEHSHLTHTDIFRIVIAGSADSAFSVDYHHVEAVEVSVGDQVEAGDRIGRVGDHIDEERGRVSLVVRRTQHVTQHLCPADFMTQDLITRLQDALERSNASQAAGSLCEERALVCASTRCESVESFAATEGDVDAGRAVYRGACASCHGATGMGNIGGPVCVDCGCDSCDNHDNLATRVALDMPPEGECSEKCAADVAAFILFAFVTPQE